MIDKFRGNGRKTKQFRARVAYYEKAAGSNLAGMHAKPGTVTNRIAIDLT